jgi:hypothetical protein
MAEEVLSLSAEGGGGEHKSWKNKQTKLTAVSKIENEIFSTKAHGYSNREYIVYSWVM